MHRVRLCLVRRSFARTATTTTATAAVTTTAKPLATSTLLNGAAPSLDLIRALDAGFVPHAPPLAAARGAADAFARCAAFATPAAATAPVAESDFVREQLRWHIPSSCGNDALLSLLSDPQHAVVPLALSAAASVIVALCARGQAGPSTTAIAAALRPYTGGAGLALHRATLLLEEMAVAGAPTATGAVDDADATRETAVVVNPETLAETAARMREVVVALLTDDGAAGDVIAVRMAQDRLLMQAALRVAAIEIGAARRAGAPPPSTTWAVSPAVVVLQRDAGAGRALTAIADVCAAIDLPAPSQRFAAVDSLYATLRVPSLAVALADLVEGSLRAPLPASLASSSASSSTNAAVVGGGAASTRGSAGYTDLGSLGPLLRLALREGYPSLVVSLWAMLSHTRARHCPVSRSCYVAALSLLGRTADAAAEEALMREVDGLRLTTFGQLIFIRSHFVAEAGAPRSFAAAAPAGDSSRASPLGQSERNPAAVAATPSAAVACWNAEHDLGSWLLERSLVRSLASTATSPDGGAASETEGRRSMARADTERLLKLADEQWGGLHQLALPVRLELLRAAVEHVNGPRTSDFNMRGAERLLARSIFSALTTTATPDGALAEAPAAVSAFVTRYGAGTADAALALLLEHIARLGPIRDLPHRASREAEQRAVALAAAAKMAQEELHVLQDIVAHRLNTAPSADLLGAHIASSTALRDRAGLNEITEALRVRLAAAVAAGAPRDAERLEEAALLAALRIVPARDWKAAQLTVAEMARLLRVDGKPDGPSEGVVARLMALQLHATQVAVPGSAPSSGETASGATEAGRATAILDAYMPR